MTDLMGDASPAFQGPEGSLFLDDDAALVGADGGSGQQGRAGYMRGGSGDDGGTGCAAVVAFGGGEENPGVIELLTGGVTLRWLAGVVTPIDGAGVSAPIGSLYSYVNPVGPNVQLWVKTDEGDTAWQPLAFGGA